MEITTLGYQSIRDLVESNWTRIAIIDNDGVVIITLPLSDARVSWVHSANTNPLILRTVLSGADTDLALPVVVGGVKLVDAFNGVLGEETLQFPFNIARTEDTLVIDCKIEIPQII